MSQEKSRSLSQLTQKLFQININSDKANRKLTSCTKKIKIKYEPRTEFNRWKQSTEGQLWKKQQYHKQQSSCAICDRLIELKGSHIDHIEPLSKYPHLSLNTANLQITCWQCNTHKSNK